MLERELDNLERQVDEVLKAAQGVMTILRRTKSACRTGTLRDIGRGLADARTSSDDLKAKLDSVQAAWTFDAESYLANGGYLNELVAVAQDNGLSLFEKEGRIFCSPLRVSLVPKNLEVLVNRTADRRLRPTALIKRLVIAHPLSCWRARGRGMVRV